MTAHQSAVLNLKYIKSYLNIKILQNIKGTEKKWQSEAKKVVKRSQKSGEANPKKWQSEAKKVVHALHWHPNN